MNPPEPPSQPCCAMSPPASAPAAAAAPSPPPPGATRRCTCACRTTSPTCTTTWWSTAAPRSTCRTTGARCAPRRGGGLEVVGVGVGGQGVGEGWGGGSGGGGVRSRTPGRRSHRRGRVARKKALLWHVRQAPTRGCAPNALIQPLNTRPPTLPTTQTNAHPNHRAPKPPARPHPPPRRLCCWPPRWARWACCSTSTASAAAWRGRTAPSPATRCR